MVNHCLEDFVIHMRQKKLVFNISYGFFVVVEFGLQTRKSGKPRKLKPQASPSVLMYYLYYPLWLRPRWVITRFPTFPHLHW